jgi:hypothetical protein
MPWAAARTAVSRGWMSSLPRPRPPRPEPRPPPPRPSSHCWQWHKKKSLSTSKTACQAVSLREKSSIYGTSAYNQFTAKHRDNYCLYGSDWTRARSNVGSIPTSGALEVWQWTFGCRTVWLVNKSAGQPQFSNSRVRVGPARAGSDRDGRERPPADGRAGPFRPIFPSHYVPSGLRSISGRTI